MRRRPVKDGNWRRVAVVALALLALSAVAAGCAKPSPPAVPLVLDVTNRLGRTIAEIWRKGCDEPDSALVELDNSKLRSGERRRFVLPATCIDLVAFDERGRQVGQQRELVMVPGASWVLRR